MCVVSLVRGFSLSPSVTVSATRRFSEVERRRRQLGQWQERQRAADAHFQTIASVLASPEIDVCLQLCLCINTSVQVYPKYTFLYTLTSKNKHQEAQNRCHV